MIPVGAESSSELCVGWAPRYRSGLQSTDPDMTTSLTARIAVVEDDPQVRPVLGGILRTAGHTVEVFSSGDDFLRSGGPGSFDVVVTDFQMEGASGMDVLKACRAEDEPADVLLVTGFGSIRNAVEAIRLGALDYLTKPVDAPELLHRVAQAIEARQLKKEVHALSGEVRRRHGLAPPIGDSAALREFLSRAEKAAATSSTVLILGETGTGKDVIARYIQASGPRANRTYLTLNCAALAETLLESELFGHARGAFSGAHAAKSGLFEEAHGGTLFLDEIGSMSLAAQAKLLRVLEDGVVRRVGETRSTRVDVRILCATNRDLKEAVRRGEFREDLFYRLSVVTLVVPPLRERPEDVEPLARHFLAESVRRLGKPRLFAPETLEFLRRYPFPGNVRELRYGIEQAVILSEDGILRPEDFPFTRKGSLAEGMARHRKQPIGEEITPERLQEALREHSGNRVRTARALNISRATLYRLLARDGEPDETAPESGS
jgi:two-component system response regulator HydG